ncbi:hypothetical protein M409DRAFT_58157 [Zasmidium cellare ATCC 36951]|uniref:F-box domain-containing protein n=1 Tax=Zasmidium cellare ATCC 36951 TaxID=1080233 RepID=A0A6A6C7E1_ZASCE|nr:uncharacterized protein M409DRAFT_58157 [Zasmidium cellare ATCC 36951]KAF2162763.1 hypothetical protein M409DRAFT_58157 [Zasmidium cellare ATCC 36951]
MASVSFHPLRRRVQAFTLTAFTQNTEDDGGVLFTPSAEQRPESTSETEAVDSETTFSSAERVFHIHELFVKIFLDVDEKNVLFAAKVNKTFLGIISASRALQRKLWFLPPVPTTVRSSDQETIEFNPHFLLPSRKGACRPFLIQKAFPAAVRREWQQFDMQGVIGINHTPAVAVNAVFANPGIEKMHGGSWERIIIAKGPVTLHLRWSHNSDDVHGWVAAARAVPRKIHCPVGTTAAKLAEKSETNMSAVTHVLNTVELLEAILLEADMKTVLLAQRVSTSWKATIGDSIMLQEKLWFRPTAVRDKSQDTNSMPGQEESQNDPFLLNPLLFPAAYGLSYTSCQHFEFSQNGHVLCRVLVYSSGKFWVRFYDDNIKNLLPPGSWQRMLVANHMQESLNVDVMMFKRSGDLWSCEEFQVPGPATMGMLVERVKEVLEKPSWRLEDVTQNIQRPNLKFAVPSSLSPLTCTLNSVHYNLTNPPSLCLSSTTKSASRDTAEAPPLFDRALAVYRRSFAHPPSPSPSCTTNSVCRTLAPHHCLQLTIAKMVTTRRQAAAASSMQVFDTAELFEMIILEVDDVKTVLLSQRVNSVFKNTIKSSKKLQRALWLLPQLETDGEVEVNPLFFRSANALVAQENDPGTPFSITEWTSSIHKLVIHFTHDVTRLQGGSWRGMQLISHGGFRSTKILHVGAAYFPILSVVDPQDYAAGTTSSELVDKIKHEIKAGIWFVVYSGGEKKPRRAIRMQGSLTED